eukprot:CAMPEP_0168201302 /NCGR_PEP_ID=MMETSP0139_2-20121125/23593_1 /TAXON_ID=44445 /ORGANISM="Pseudo-nitzschia australis, Strain 10249 10 AB" /LENGTH=88 /DNA_ID=CAMNT_0008126767 /DNA_START=423 /DNA_END=686 /DNA_ORIENTATION=+
MEGGSTSAPSTSGEHGVYNDDGAVASSVAGSGNGASGNNNNANVNVGGINVNNVNVNHDSSIGNTNGRGGSRRLSNIEQQLLADDNAA